MPTSEPEIYQIKVVLQRISPMIWRHLLIRGGTTFADLHCIIQIAMGWSDDHLHQFRIHEKRYGIARMGGVFFSDDPDAVRLKDLGLRINERFVYEYDFTDNWQHLILAGKIVTAEGTCKRFAFVNNYDDKPMRDCLKCSNPRVCSRINRSRSYPMVLIPSGICNCT